MDVSHDESPASRLTIVHPESRPVLAAMIAVWVLLIASFLACSGIAFLSRVHR